MVTRSVTYRKQAELISSSDQAMSIANGVEALKKMAAVKGDRTYKNGKKRKSTEQSVEIVMHLGIDPRHADQMVRGALSLPKGLGKSRVVIAFCEGDLAEKAIAAGAAEAGGDELVKKIQDGWLDFDVAIAHPSMMGKVGKLGRVLGPQGKMPSPKAGTVTPDVETAAKEFSMGRLEYRNDAGGNIHLPVGKIGFPVEDLKENIEAVISHITSAKPTATKGQYIKRICISATRTPSVTIDAAA